MLLEIKRIGDCFPAIRGEAEQSIQLCSAVQSERRDQFSTDVAVLKALVIPNPRGMPTCSSPKRPLQLDWLASTPQFVFQVLLGCLETHPLLALSSLPKYPRCLVRSCT